MVGLGVGEDGGLPLPWLATPLRQALHEHRGHALLVHGAAGVGALSFAITLAQAWLCESDAAPRPCGRCGSCRLIQSRLHPDLTVLLPETLRRRHDWPLVDDRTEGDDGKRKPSRQIRIDEVRGLIDWSTKTSARGRGKVAVLHPAEALNPQSGNALLKTLEEPAPGTRLVLTCGDPSLLLPTVRSRCQRLRLAAPAQAEALAWLAGQGLADVASARILLDASSGRPLDALAMAQAGIDAAAWASLPQAVARRQSAVFGGWPVPQVLDALQKLCHDAMAQASGGTSRYFPPDGIPAAGNLGALVDWSRELVRVARDADHPWNEGLLLDALVGAGAVAMAPSPAPALRRAEAAAFDTLPP